MKIAGSQLPRSILIVDDDADTREVVTTYFQREGFIVRSAANGQKALAMVSTIIPDVIILDMRMPELDGVGFLQVIRSYLRWTTLPVVMLTAYPEGEQIDRARELGVRDVFRKSGYRLGDLRKCIDRIISEEEQAGTRVG